MPLFHNTWFWTAQSHHNFFNDYTSTLHRFFSVLKTQKWDFQTFRKQLRNTQAITYIFQLTSPQHAINLAQHFIFTATSEIYMLTSAKHFLTLEHLKQQLTRLCLRKRWFLLRLFLRLANCTSVSYTHLTLPTILRV